jgi:hypothetical protein
MSVNALYCKWVEGFTWVSNVPSGRRRRERQVDLTGATHAEVLRIGNALLDEFNDVRSQITVDVDPKSDAERAYLGYRKGDTVMVPDVDGTPTAERVRSITSTWTKDSPGGHPQATPQLRDVILSSRDAFQVQIERMNRGALNGHSPSVGVPADPSGIGDISVEPFHQVWSVPTVTGGGT